MSVQQQKLQIIKTITNLVHQNQLRKKQLESWKLKCVSEVQISCTGRVCDSTIFII